MLKKISQFSLLCTLSYSLFCLSQVLVVLLFASCTSCNAMKAYAVKHKSDYYSDSASSYGYQKAVAYVPTTYTAPIFYNLGTQQQQSITAQSLSQTATPLMTTVSQLASVGPIALQTSPTSHAINAMYLINQASAARQVPSKVPDWIYQGSYLAQQESVYNNIKGTITAIDSTCTICNGEISTHTAHQWINTITPYKEILSEYSSTLHNSTYGLVHDRSNPYIIRQEEVQKLQQTIQKIECNLLQVVSHNEITYKKHVDCLRTQCENMPFEEVYRHVELKLDYCKEYQNNIAKHTESLVTQKKALTKAQTHILDYQSSCFIS